MKILENNNGNNEYIIYNEWGEEIYITEEQYSKLLELKQKLENLNPYDIEKHIEKHNNNGLPMKAIVFVSENKKRIVLLYREKRDTLVDVIRDF